MNTIFGMELISRGGPLMIALLICSIVAVAIIVERLISLRYSAVIKLKNLREIEVAIRKKELKTALEWTENTKAPMIAIAKVALINADKSKEDLKASIEEAGRMAIPRLERYLTILQTITVISPLLGLLGTVTGMIEVFQTIVSEGTGNANILAGGISQALLTTATGLSIAIPTLIFYNFLNKRVDNLVVEMEHQSIVLHELLTQNYPRRAN